MRREANQIPAIIGKILILLVVYLASYPVFAQLKENKVIEFTIRGEMIDEYNLTPLGEDGLLIINPQSTYYGRNAKVNFMKYDTSLNFIWRSTYDQPDGFKMEKYFQNEKYIYTLFRETEKLNIKIVRVDLISGDRVVTDAKLLTRTDTDFFSVIGSKAIIGGRYNDKPVVEMISLFDQSAKVLPQLHSNNVRINAIEINESSSLIYVMLSDENNCKFTLSIYDYDGKPLNSRVLGEKNKVLLNGKLLHLPDNQLVLAGNYADNCTDYSSGFYLYPLIDNEKIKYFNFSDLNNFFNYLPERRQKKMKSRMLARKEKGKETRIRHRLLLHEIQTDDDGITFTAEVFYPEYKSNPNSGLNTIRSLNSTLATPGYNNFRFTHAIVCDFDFNGNLTWDHSIDLKNLESTFLEEKVQVTKIDDKYLLAYPDENMVKTQLISRNQKVTETSKLDLKASSSKKIIDDFASELSSWYANTFVAYGVKTVRSEGGLTVRDIFFLSKLSYNPSDSKKLSDQP